MTLRPIGCIATTALFLLASHPALGQTTWTRQALKPLPTPPPAAIPAGTVFIPFPVPEPESTATPSFRKVETLEVLFGNAGPIPGVLRRAMVGGSPGTTSNDVSGRILFAISVSAPVPGVAGDERPDGSKKGRALITAGLHPREWMAIEATVRKLQKFQDGTVFGKSVTDTRAGTAPGNRDVFFAENLGIVFMPVVTSTGLKVTQLNFDSCHMVTSDDPNITELRRGSLREGRLRRKSLDTLVASAKSLGLDETTDPDALAGININRDFVATLTGLSASLLHPLSSEYVGALKREPESLAIENVAKGIFVSATASYTGVAFLDVHTDANDVIFPGPRASDPFAAYADAVKKGAYPTRKTGASANTSIKGTVDTFIKTTYKVPSATLELPTDPKISSYRISTLGQTMLGDTSESLSFFVSEADYTRQAGIGEGGIDAALDWATGPPYAKEILLLQDKAVDTDGDGKRDAPDGKYDPKLLKGDAEVVHSSRWIANGSTARTLTPRVAGERWLNSATPVTFVVVFSKPMRAATNGLDPSLVFTTTGGSTVTIGTAGSTTGKWEDTALLTVDATSRTKAITTIGADRYSLDTWVRTLTLPKTITIRTATGTQLKVLANDRNSRALDSNPGTVAQWANGVDTGLETGEDSSQRGFFVDTKNPVAKAGRPGK